MKEKENLASTNQLIRFIRGDVKYEEFYDQPPQIESKSNRKPMIIIYGVSLLAGFLLILAGRKIITMKNYGFGYILGGSESIEKSQSGTMKGIGL